MTRQPGGQGRKIDKHAGQPPTATSSRSLALSQPEVFRHIGQEHHSE